MRIGDEGDEGVVMFDAESGCKMCMAVTGKCGLSTCCKERMCMFCEWKGALMHDLQMEWQVVLFAMLVQT